MREALEAEEVEPGVWRTALDGSRVEEDEGVVALARRVLGDAGKYTVDLREGKGVQVGDGNTQHHHFAGRPVIWPRRIGVVPPLAAGRVKRDADSEAAAGYLILRGL